MTTQKEKEKIIELMSQLRICFYMPKISINENGVSIITYKWINQKAKKLIFFQ